MVSSVLRLDAVHALAVLAFAGLELQAHLLADLRAQETSHAVLLPTSGFGKIRERGSFFASQQFDNGVSFRVATFGLRCALCTALAILALAGFRHFDLLVRIPQPIAAGHIHRSGQTGKQGNSETMRRVHG